MQMMSKKLEIDRSPVLVLWRSLVLFTFPSFLSILTLVLLLLLMMMMLLGAQPQCTRCSKRSLIMYFMI